MNTTTKTNRTAEVLHSMFTENTGKHLLDSGGAYGRHWERNQGLTLSDFMEAPSAFWQRDWGVTTNAFTYCLNRLTYSKTAEVLTRLMNVWELSDYENRNLYGMGDQEAYLEHLGAQVGKGWNSYNWENSLTQDLQGYDFELMGQKFTLLQVHGGCDARGGYTLPKIFEAHCEYWLAGTEDVTLECHTCEIAGYVYDSYAAPNEWRRYGELPAPLFGEPERYLVAPEGYNLVNGCPECGGDLTATNESECY